MIWSTVSSLWPFHKKQGCRFSPAFHLHSLKRKLTLTIPLSSVWVLWRKHAFFSWSTSYNWTPKMTPKRLALHNLSALCKYYVTFHHSNRSYWLITLLRFEENNFNPRICLTFSEGRISLLCFGTFQIWLSWRTYSSPSHQQLCTQAHWECTSRHT